ncbi:MAG: hypothetical protein DRJ05_19150 [Bacteroidetes bacterium]|nr:MAG: hypothetical protein DRJ05_19150 [Bacteroidota bacterium]
MTEEINIKKPVFRPTDPKARITQVDILRGFALFGVLLVNVFGYNSSFFDFGGFYKTFNDPLNSMVFNLVIGFGADKFIFIFSFLFGVGFSIMYLKYQADEQHFYRLYLRRLLVLMLFGIIHIVFFWAGDILFSYSLMGIILLFSRKLHSGLLLFFSVFAYFYPIIHIALQSVLPFLPDALSSVTDITMPTVIDIYSGGSYSEIFILRLNEYYAFRNINLIYYAPKVISLFFLGYLFYKHKYLERINSSPGRYSVVFVVLFTIGIVLNLFTDNIVNTLADPETNSFYLAIYMLVFEITNIFLGLSYILMILILSQIVFFKTILNPLKYVGRMALTNYLMQSIIFTTIMYSYGFGKFGSFQPWQLVIFAVVVFVLQIFISKIWLQNFRFGPLEWIWRKLTYLGIDNKAA